MKQRNSFTLVELLTVIAIIVLLVSIFLPSLQNVKQQVDSVTCRSTLRNDISFSPVALYRSWCRVELVLVSLNGLSGRPTIVGKLLVWEQIPENPVPYGSYGSNLWICDNRCISTKCHCRHCWIPHTCTNQSEENVNGIFSGSLVNKIDQKQSAQ
jgi:hypothetical protein